MAADFSDEFLAKGKDVKTELAKLLELQSDSDGDEAMADEQDKDE